MNIRVADWTEAEFVNIESVPGTCPSALADIFATKQSLNMELLLEKENNPEER